MPDLELLASASYQSLSKEDRAALKEMKKSAKACLLADRAAAKSSRIKPSVTNENVSMSSPGGCRQKSRLFVKPQIRSAMLNASIHVKAKHIKKNSTIKKKEHRDAGKTVAEVASSEPSCDEVPEFGGFLSPPPKSTKRIEEDMNWGFPASPAPFQTHN